MGLLVTLAVVLALPIHAAQVRSYTGRPVADILQELQTAELRIIFSTTQMRIAAAATQRSQLRANVSATNVADLAQTKDIGGCCLPECGAAHWSKRADGKGPMSMQATLNDVPFSSDEMYGVSIDTLEPGTTVRVETRHSHYRFVILDFPGDVLVTGGFILPEGTIVRLEGSTDGGSDLKIGWILVGLKMELRFGAVRIVSSRVRAVTIQRTVEGHA